MPFYEYECSSCKFYSEVLQKISDTPLKKCPNCSKQTFKRLISAPVFRLKGGGWYETDFKSDQESKRNLAGREEAESKSEDSKSEDSKSEGSKAEDSKTETKAEAKPAEGSKGESKGGTKRSSKPAKRAPAAKPKKASKPTPKAKKKSKR
jgi:putative FmdB family regulatory protein